MATVDLVYSPDCPNVPLARANLLLAFARAGVRPRWSEHRIGDPDAPEHTRGYGSPTILIGGGYDKKSSYDEWVATFEGRVKELLLIGKTKHDIAAACDRAGFKAYKFVDTLEEAVSIAAADAESGDCVLLSPACASWDMFKCYQQRGEIFKDCVRAL